MGHADRKLVKSPTLLRCAWCGRPLEKFTSTELVPKGSATNQIVVREREGYGRDGSKVDRTTWDGESYWAYAGLFDRLRCGINFAAAAHGLGFRRKPPTT